VTSARNGKIVERGGSDLTLAAARSISPQWGGDCMKGSVQFHKPAARYYISWYPVKIWKNPITREPFWHKRNAEKILDKMRCGEEAGENMILKTIVKKWLKENEYDGLFSFDCGCRRNDLFPCGADPGHCEPGYLKIAIDDYGKTGWIISGKKRVKA
jgi:hypothetical protein